MPAYPVNLEVDGDSIVVTFPDVPEAITQGECLSHALEMAAEALETAMDFYLESGRPLPVASPPHPGQEVVELPENVLAKFRIQDEVPPANGPGM